MKALLGTKVGMTNLFSESGKRYAATVIYVEPNQVLETKTLDKNGYVSTKVGYETISEKNVNKPKLGYFKKVKSSPKRTVKELRGVEGYNVGDQIKVDIFETGQYVDVQAYTKGHGFTGSIKRHNFSVGPLGHGAGYPHRYVGSISGGRGGSQAQRVFKGTELPGHYGNELVTIQNQLILDIDKEKNIIIIHGAVPGPKNSVVKIQLSQKMMNKKEDIKLYDASKKTAKPVVEETKTEQATAPVQEAAQEPQQQPEPAATTEAVNNETKNEGNE